MSRRLLLARLHQPVPMGQQSYESNLERELRAIGEGGWEIEHVDVASARADAPGLVRVPARLLWSLPYPAARAVGKIVYPRHDLCHRLDLRCPPAAREVVTLHDLPARHFDDEGRLARSALDSLRRARVVLAVSEFTAKEARLLGASNVRVVPNGLDPAYFEAEPAPAALLERLGVRGPYVLHAAGATKRKNLDALAEAWRLVGAEAPAASLVLAGPPHPRRDAAFRRVPQAVIAGWLEPRVVASLMRSAAAIVVPSLYDGFGLPALEGLALGTPVVAADRGALPEVCGEAALLVEPTPRGLADGLLEVLTEPALADRLREIGPRRAARFTWTSAARATLEAYDEAMA